PAWRDAGRTRVGLASRRGWRGLVSALHPGPHLLSRFRPDAPAYVPRSRGHLRALPAPALGLPRGWLRLGALLDGAHGRGVCQTRRRSARAPQASERVHSERIHLLLLRSGRMAAAAGREVLRRESDRLRVRLPALGPQLPRLDRRDQGARRHHGCAEAQDSRRKYAPPLRPQALRWTRTRSHRRRDPYGKRSWRGLNLQFGANDPLPRTTAFSRKLTFTNDRIR